MTEVRPAFHHGSFDEISFAGYPVGNHDVVWMGAATGQKACIATVIRNSIRYRNMDILEDGYGINLMLWQPLQWSL